MAPYTPDTRVEEEVATPEPQLEPEVPAIADPWKAPQATSGRRWIKSSASTNQACIGAGDDLDF